MNLAEQMESDAAPAPQQYTKPPPQVMNLGARMEQDAMQPAPKSKPVLASASPRGEETQSEDASRTSTGDTGPLGGVVAHTFTGLGSSIMGGWHGLATLASGGTLDDAANVVNKYNEEHVYQPEQGSSAAKALDVLDSPYNPLTALPRIAKKAGEKSQDMGASPGVATAIETGINAVPLLFGLKGGAAAESRVIPFPRVEPTLRGDAPIVRAAPLSEPGIGTPLPSVGGRAEPVLSPQASEAAIVAKVKTADNWAKAQHDLDEALSKNDTPKAVIDDLQAKASAAEQAHKQLELVPAEPKAVTPTETPQAPTTEETAVPKFEEASDIPSEEGKGLSQPEQLDRAKLLNRLGVNTTRLSAVSGDAKAAGTDFQSSLLDSPGGKLMHETLKGERDALTNYASGLVEKTGGTAGTDSSALYARGDSIVSPFDSLNDYFNKEIKKSYADARERAKDQPFTPHKLNSVMGENSAFTSNTDTLQLRNGVRDRMQELGMMDKDGNLFSSTVDQAENLRQYLNESWTPKNSRVVGRLKNALDDDVTWTAGEDIFNKARALRHMKSAIFENDTLDPQGRTIKNGLAKILDANGKNVELLKDTEKVPDIVTALPVDQFGHMVSALKTMPKELQPQAQAALAEIKAHFANKILEAGSKPASQWGANGVTEYLKRNGTRMQQVFSPDEIAEFQDLNRGGHVLEQGQRYPGAEAQKQNLMQRGALKVAPAAAGMAAEALTGGMTLGNAGRITADAVKNKLEASQSLSSTQKRLVKLRDFPGLGD